MKISYTKRLIAARFGHLIVIAFFILGCDEKEKTSDNRTSVDLPQEYTTFEVEWRDDAVINDDLVAVQEAIVSMDYENGILVIREDYIDIDSLEVGKTALIAGVGIFTVTARDVVDEGVRLTLETAPLTSVIENGTIAWRRNFTGQTDVLPIGVGIGEDEATSIRQVTNALTGSFESGELSASGKVGVFDTSFTLRKSDGSISMSVSAKYQGSGNSIVNIVGSGALYGLSNETQIVIEGSSIKDFVMMADNVNGEISLEAGAVEIGASGTPVKIPAKISVPILVGGIPFYVALGGTLEINSTLKANCSAIIKGKSTFTGSAGIRAVDGVISPAGGLQQSELIFEKADHVGTVTAGYGVLLNFPKLSVGVGLSGMISGEAYVQFSTEAISNMDLFYESAGLTPVIVGNCVKSRVNIGGFYGGKAEFLGITVAETETALFGKLGEEKKTGNKCE